MSLNPAPAGAPDEETPASGPPAALGPSGSRGWRAYVSHLLAREISRLTRYFDSVIQWQPRREDTGALLAAVECPQRAVASSLSELPPADAAHTARHAILIHGNFNHDYDIEDTLRQLKTGLDRRARVVSVAYNAYYGPLYRLASRLGIRRGEPPCSFLTLTDLTNIAALSGYEIVKVRPCVYFPWRLLGLGNLVNSLFVTVPLLRWLALAAVIVLRPIFAEPGKPSLSIVIPARNERGNIANALEELPDFAGTELEVIFVEGHSTDGTWEEIQRVVAEYSGPLRLKAFQQSGRGKADAVRLGFAHAENDLLTILDADLTMPPRLLVRFYAAYCSGLADFVNGSRLVYPMEGGAMRFLNVLGNVFFSKALSFVLDARLGDTLCGTKLLSRDDYARFTRWRQDFGDFDPFGDYELLFPATALGLGVVDVPVRYRDRTYGSTNISRFRHGALLFKMTWIGFWRLKLGSAARRGP